MSQHPYIQKLESTRYGFFVKNYKLSFLIVILLIFYGTFAAIQIPKESSPDIKFGIVSIMTAYPGANPLDIDSIITEKVEKEIKDLEGIDKYESSSAVGVSSTTITLKNDVDVNKFIDDVKQKVDKISFPDDVKDPQVSELSTRNEVLFQMMLYAPKKDFSMNHLRSLAYDFADQIEGKGGIVDVGVDGNIQSNSRGGAMGASNGGGLYNLSVLLDRGKLENLGLTISSIVQTIKAFNQNLPLGNHELADLSYDYRISGEKSELSQLLDIPVQLPKGGYVKLADLAKIERSYSNNNISYGGIVNSADNHAVALVIYKANRINIFNVAKSAKQVIEETLQKPLFSGIKSAYTQDLSDIIVDDYKNLGSNALQAIVMIFLITWFFIGFRQSLIATLSMPIAFFITFIYLNANGSTLNFMTNFSLVLSFGMGIDTVIVIIEAAYEYMKKGFDPKSAVLIAMKNYVFPNISSSLCNMIVFLPMMLLPGIMGKFLSYIPITIFVTLLGSTILASTLNNALFIRFNKNLPYYYEDDDKEGTFTAEEHKVLDEARKGKEVKGRETQPRSDKRVQSIADGYVSLLKKTMATKFSRVMTYVSPVVLLILSFIFLSSSIGFKLFPSGDNPSIMIDITAKEGTTSEAMTKYAQGIDKIFASIPELKSYQINIIPSKLDISVLLVKKGERERNSFVIQDEIMKQLSSLQEQGLKVESKVQAGGPPSGKAVGIKLTADDAQKLNELKRISLDFEQFLKNIPGTMNVTNSSSNNPGQFNFRFDEQKLAELGLTPNDVQFELYNALNGSKAGTINLDKEDRDIVVKYDSLDTSVNPEKVMDTPITTRLGPVKLSSIASYNVNQALSTIRRVDGDMVLTVESDVVQGVAPTTIQPKLEAYAASYSYPDGLSFKNAGENEANKELIQATFVALGLALFLVFAILVFEFNSFGKPLIILYSILTALLGANIGMYVTGNPYSMPFMIGFISLIGIVVNMAIFLVDRMNENLNRGLTIEQAIIEAGTTRFKPVVISSITTIFGIVGLAFQDEFWAGLGWTVVFGLLCCAFITLFALPNLFYSAYGNKENQ